MMLLYNSTFNNESNYTTVPIHTFNSDENTIKTTNKVQEYFLWLFLIICVCLIVFIVFFVHNLCCMFCKSFNCCKNDSFCYLCEYAIVEANDNKIKMENILNTDAESDSTFEPLLEVPDPSNFYGIFASTSNRLAKSNRSEPNLSLANDFYSTFTFKSFKSGDEEQKKEKELGMKAKLDEDYMDICNTLTNVAVSINEMLAIRELEQIETNLSKSVTEIQKIQVEMCTLNARESQSMPEDAKSKFTKQIEEADEISLESPNESTLVSDSGMLPMPGMQKLFIKIFQSFIFILFKTRHAFIVRCGQQFKK